MRFTNDYVIYLPSRPPIKVHPQAKVREADPNNNRPPEPPSLLLRPREVIANPPPPSLLLRPREVIAVSPPPSVAVPIPSPLTPGATSSSTLSISPEEELRRTLYLPLGRPRPFYRVPEPSEGQVEVGQVVGRRK